MDESLCLEACTCSNTSSKGVACLMSSIDIAGISPQQCISELPGLLLYGSLSQRSDECGAVLCCAVQAVSAVEADHP
jgi:hypothetical protein